MERSHSDVVFIYLIFFLRRSACSKYYRRKFSSAPNILQRVSEATFSEYLLEEALDFLEDVFGDLYGAVLGVVVDFH